MRKSIASGPVFLTLALGLTAADPGAAAVTFVDPPDIPIPITFGGIYLDFGAGVTDGSMESGSGSADDWTVSFSQPADTDWDVNFFFGGAGIAHNTTLQPYRGDAENQFSAIHNLELGLEVDGTAVGPSLSAPLSTAAFGGSGGSTGVAAANTHMLTGSEASKFTNGNSGYIAFVLDPDTTPQFGWMEVTLNDDGTPGSIDRWAFSDSPIQVGVPEPSSLALLGLASAMLLLRRRA